MNLNELWKYCEMAKQSGHEFSFGNPDKGDYGFGVALADKVIIAIRGSDDLQDWYSNIFKTKLTTGGYHAGFEAGCDSIFHAVEKFAIRFMKHKPIWFVAHSRGGAVACILAAKLKWRYLSATFECVTFNSPKFCNEDARFDRFVLDGEISHTLIINGNDPVPELPWWGPYVRSVSTVAHVGKRSLLSSAIIKLALMTQSKKWILAIIAKYGKDHRSAAIAESLKDLG